MAEVLAAAEREEGWVPRLGDDGGPFHPTLVSLMAIEMSAHRDLVARGWMRLRAAAELQESYAV